MYPAQNDDSEYTGWIKKLDHLVITAKDAEKTAEFYQKLGFKYKEGSGRKELFCEGCKINIHQRGSELLPHAGIVQPGSVDICFELSVPLGEMTKRLKKNQIAIEEGPISRMGFRGPMTSIYIRDPDGNLVEFSSYDSQ